MGSLGRDEPCGLGYGVVWVHMFHEIQAGIR